MRSIPSLAILRRFLTDEEIRDVSRRATVISGMSRFELAVCGLAPLVDLLRRRWNAASKDHLKKEESSMGRIGIAAILSLSLGGTSALADQRREDPCASAFLSERLGADDAAIMQGLWFKDAGNESGESVPAEPRYRVEEMNRVAAKFLEFRGEFQIRCPAVALDLE